MSTRVCLVGPKGAGKSSIAARIDGPSVSSQKSHSDTAFASCDISFCERNLHFEILDISGEERLRCMAPIFCKEARAALCVFDLTSGKSYRLLHSWIECIRNNAFHECLLTVLGNKVDLQLQREVSKETAEAYAQSIGAKYYEVSAVTGVGIMNVLVDLAKEIIFWEDCSSTYAAKRSIVANTMEYISPKMEQKKRRFSFPLRKSSFNQTEQ